MTANTNFINIILYEKSNVVNLALCLCKSIDGSDHSNVMSKRCRHESVIRRVCHRCLRTSCTYIAPCFWDTFVNAHIMTRALQRLAYDNAVNNLSPINWQLSLPFRCDSCMVDDSFAICIVRATKLNKLQQQCRTELLWPSPPSALLMHTSKYYSCCCRCRCLYHYKH